MRALVLVLALGPVGAAPVEPPPTAAASRRGVVFLARADDATDAAVIEAMHGQLADLDARLWIEPMPERPDLGARLLASRRHALEHRAVGVFWLDVGADGELLLHLVDPAGERMLVRRIEPSPQSETAAIQTVAVIARGFASALLEGRSIGMTEVRPPTPAEDSEAPPLRREPLRAPDRERGRARLDAAYYGAFVAPEAEWRFQSGLSLGAAWQWPVGVHVGAGYDLTGKFTAVSASLAAANTITSEVRRNPISARGGYQHRWRARPIALDADVRLVVDPHTVRQHEAMAGSIVARQSVSTFVMIAPRLSVHLRPVEYFSAFGGAGAEIVVRGARFSAVFRDADTGDEIDRVTYLSPRIVRPVVFAGIAFYL
jgi:hypothetical protein